MSAHILVIEDEKNLRESIVRLLRFEEYVVTAARDGEEGLALARTHLPDLILCDILMPRLDGYGVLSALRDDPATRTIPVIFLTAKTERSDLRRGMALGASDYITKPFTESDLLNAIEARLQRQETVLAALEQPLDTLRQSIVHALPLELRALLADIMGRATSLEQHAHALAPDDVYEAARFMRDAAYKLQRHIENYLIFTHLDILRLSAERVIIGRDNCLDSPAALIVNTARAVAAGRQRVAGLTLTVDDVPVCISEYSLTKIVEELISYMLAESAPGTAVRITSMVSEDAYDLFIEARHVTPAPDVLAALDMPPVTVRELQELRAPIIGLIVAKHLLAVHQGTLVWHSSPAGGLLWTARLARHKPSTPD